MPLNAYFETGNLSTGFGPLQPESYKTFGGRVNNNKIIQYLAIK